MKSYLSIKNEICKTLLSLETVGTIELECGEYFLTINKKTNTLYVANNKFDSILVIGGSAKKIVNRIQIERPRELVIDSENNILYAISGDAGWRLHDNGARISIINLITNQIINSIGEKEGFGDIELNQKTKLLYATQTKSKKVWVVDIHTNSIIDKIKVGAKYRSIAIDESSNMIYIVGRGGITDDSIFFTVIDGKNNHVEKIVSKFYFSGRWVPELHYNQINNKLYAYMEQPKTGEPSGTSFYIQEIDLKSKSFEKKKLKSRDMQDGMEFDQSRNRFYFSDVKNGEFSVLNESLDEIGLFRFTESKSFVETRIQAHGEYSKIVINSSLQLIYIAGSKMNLLHIIKE